MTSAHEDLDEVLEKFKKLFQSQRRRKKIENDLLHLTERLCKELESSESNAKHWESCYKALLSHDDTNLTTKYVALTEKYDQLVLKHNNLKTEFDEKEKQYQEELENQKNDLTRRLAESEEKFKTEILDLNNRMESDKICYATKEKQLLNELQASQAATYLQIDEIESNLKSQIVDLNKKLKQSQSQARLLMAEIGKLKNQLANQKQSRHTLNFQETPIQAARINLLRRSIARDVNNFYTESDENINSFDLHRPLPKYSTNSTVGNISKENNNENIQKNTNTLNIRPIASLYSATPPVAEITQPKENVFTSAQNNHEQIFQESNSGYSCSYDENNNNEVMSSEILQQKSTATPNKFQQLSCQAETSESKQTRDFQRHTGTPLYKDSGTKKNYVLPSKMSTSDNKDVRNKPRKRKLFDPDKSYMEPKE